MNRRFLLFALALSALSLASLAPAQVTKQGSAYKFRMAWKPGDVYKYNIAINVQMANGKTVPTSGDSTMRVISVKDGIATVEVESIDPNSKSPKKSTVKMDSLGPVGETPGLGGISDQRLPDKPLKIGETWNSTRTVKQGNRAIELVSTYVLRAVKDFQGTKCAIFDVKAVTKGVDSMSTGTLYLEVKSGQLFNLDMKTKITMGQGPKAQSIESNTLVKRVK